MGAIAGLFLLGLLFFGGRFEPVPKCPPLYPEETPLFKQHMTLRYLVGDKVVEVVDREKSPSVTSTLLGGTFRMEKVGTTTDKEAIEHNKRVQECRTINGEF